MANLLTQYINNILPDATVEGATLRWDATTTAWVENTTTALNDPANATLSLNSVGFLSGINTFNTYINSFLHNITDMQNLVIINGVNATTDANIFFAPEVTPHQKYYCTVLSYPNFAETVDKQMYNETVYCKSIAIGGNIQRKLQYWQNIIGSTDFLMTANVDDVILAKPTVAGTLFLPDEVVFPMPNDGITFTMILQNPTNLAITVTTTNGTKLIEHKTTGVLATSAVYTDSFIRVSYIYNYYDNTYYCLS